MSFKIGKIKKRNAGNDFFPTLFFFFFLLFFFVPGCGPTARPEAPVLMICVDGMEMSVVKPMLARGDLPNFAALIDRGVYGYLGTLVPAESPVVWTTVATGKSPESHGITGFTDSRTKGPFTSNARRGKAFWNITTDYGLACDLVGYWVTWPAEEIRGEEVTQICSRVQAENQKMVKGTIYRDLEGAAWPPGLMEELWPLVRKAGDRNTLIRDVVSPVFGNPAELDVNDETKELITSSFWSMEADAIYHAIARRLFAESPGALNVVYFGGTDVIGHRFWRYREPELYRYKIPRKDIKAFGHSIEEYYRIVDRMVGELVKLFPRDARIVVLSDHGMHADFLDGTANGRPTNLSAHHLDGPPGVLIVAGQGIRKGNGVAGLVKGGEIPSLGTVFDIAPTLLYLLDIPVGRDMRLGRVMKNVVTPEQIRKRPVEFVETHDEGFRPATPSLSSEEADREFVKRFEALGYLR